MSRDLCQLIATDILKKAPTPLTVHEHSNTTPESCHHDGHDVEMEYYWRQDLINRKHFDGQAGNRIVADYGAAAKGELIIKIHRGGRM